MKKFVNKNWIYLAGALVGAIAGYFYYREIGCSSGTCMITSKPLNSTVYFGVMGALLFGFLKKETHAKQ